MNWVHLAFLGGAGALLLSTRLLTVWFLVRRLRIAPDQSDSEMEQVAEECLDPRTHPVPIFVSFLYSLIYVFYAAMAVWGTVSTAWWVLLLAVLLLILIHVPFRETMAGLWELEKLSMLKLESGGSLNELRGDQSPSEETGTRPDQ